MITNDPTDIAYAKACQEIFDLIDRVKLSDVEINSQLRAVHYHFFGEFDVEPACLMLQEVDADIVFDRFDPEYGIGDPGQALAKARQIITDYLAGNFYPSYYSLHGSYGGDGHGYSWDMRINNGRINLRAGEQVIYAAIQNVADSISNISNASDKDNLESIQRLLPQSIDGLSLLGSEITEYLS